MQEVGGEVADSEKVHLRQFVSVQDVSVTDVLHNVDGYKEAG